MEKTKLLKERWETREEYIFDSYKGTDDTLTRPFTGDSSYIETRTGIMCTVIEKHRDVIYISNTNEEPNTEIQYSVVLREESSNECHDYIVDTTDYHNFEVNSIVYVKELYRTHKESLSQECIDKMREEWDKETKERERMANDLIECQRNKAIHDKQVSDLIDWGTEIYSKMAHVDNMKSELNNKKDSKTTVKNVSRMCFVFSILFCIGCAIVTALTIAYKKYTNFSIAGILLVGCALFAVLYGRFKYCYKKECEDMDKISKSISDTKEQLDKLVSDIDTVYSYVANEDDIKARKDKTYFGGFNIYDCVIDYLRNRGLAI